MKDSKVQNPSSKVKPKLTQSRLKELLHYNPDTGIFRWKISKGTVKKGTVAKFKDCGYMKIRIDKKLYLASRLAFLWMEGYFPEFYIDHINRMTDDNRWCNLRHVSSSCNKKNSNVRNDNKSGITGISFYGPNNKWRCYINNDSGRHHLGYFSTLREAAKARWDAEVRYGYPNCNTTSSAYQFLTSTLSTH